MKKNASQIIIFLFVSLFLHSCSDSDDAYVPISPVQVDLTTVPYQKLSDYHFFEGDLKLQIPALDVLPYQPASALFTDYAHKKRFILITHIQMAQKINCKNGLMQAICKIRFRLQLRLP